MMSVLTHLLETDIPPSSIANANQAHWELLMAWINPFAVFEACATQETSIITQYLSSLLRSIRPPDWFWDKAFYSLLGIVVSMHFWEFKPIECSTSTSVIPGAYFQDLCRFNPNLFPIPWNQAPTETERFTSTPAAVLFHQKIVNSAISLKNWLVGGNRIWILKLRQTTRGIVCSLSWFQLILNIKQSGIKFGFLLPSDVYWSIVRP